MNLKLNRLFLAALVDVSIFMLACGHDSKQSGQSIKYHDGRVTSEDVARQIKFDAGRQERDDTDDKKLVIHVHQSWVASPPGLKERSLNQWYSMWQASRAESQGLEVEVQYEGTPVAKWTAARGYELVEQKRSGNSES